MSDYPYIAVYNGIALFHNLYEVEALEETGVALFQENGEHASEDAPDCEECRKLLSKLGQGVSQ